MSRKETPTQCALPARLDLGQYDQRVTLNHAERERIAGVASDVDSLHLRLGDPLARLLSPLKD
jgi:hypothetical protein